MDSKQLNQLDPKLKETYERVMGTPLNKSFTQPLPPQLPTNMPKTPFPSATPVTTQTPTRQPSPKPFQPQPATYNVGQNQKPQTQIAKKQNKMTPIFIVIGSFIFIILYALIWIKVLNLEVPFLPF